MKKIKIVTIILSIVLITLVAFGGVYIQNQNRMENKVKDYLLSKEIEGSRVVEIKPVDGTEASKLTEENYQTIKNTIINRLNAIGSDDYNIALNKSNGIIRVELPENDMTDYYTYYLVAQGQVQIEEKDSKTVLLNDSMVKSSKFNYDYKTDGSYQVYVDIELTQEGQAKVEEISKNYAILKNEVEEIEKQQEAEEEKTEEENNVTEETTQQKTKKIAVLKIGSAEKAENDEEENTATEYDIEKIDKNKIRILIGATTTNSETVQNNMSVAADISMLINSGKYPINYDIENNRYEYSDITTKELKIFSIIVLSIVLFILLIITIKYKTKGLLVSISFIGFISLLSLILRYTNVQISIEGIGAILLILAINFKFNIDILKTQKVNMITEVMKNVYKNTFISLIPIAIIIIVFSFTKWYSLMSFGMIMFWGILLIAIYNICITKTLLNLVESK